MPELPEVETIKRGLEKKIIGLSIKKIELLSPKSFIGNPKLVLNKKVLNIERKAKLLIAKLSGDLSLIIHLKMSGQIIVIPSETRNLSQMREETETSSEILRSAQDDRVRFIGGHPTLDMLGKMPHQHTRVIFNFSDGSKLYFNDQRRFGWIKIVDSSQATVDSLFKKLGPEPLEKEFSWQILKKNLLRHKSMPVKVAILDQSVVSGIGNIYASEACFLAKIDPQTKVSKLTDTQFKKLYQGIIESLNTGIKYGGSTKTHFVDAEGNKGYFLDYAYVYGLDKKKCKKCQTEIKKIQLGGRGTYFCPSCQK